MNFTINDIQTLLRVGGIIKIGSRVEQLLCASFTVDRNDPVSVSSDRGFEHLFECLLGEATNDASLVNAANDRYPYPTTMQDSSEIMNILQGSYTEISRINSMKFKVMSYRTDIPSNRVPGIYCKIGEGGSVEKAFEAAFKAEPMLL